MKIGFDGFFYIGFFYIGFSFVLLESLFDSPFDFLTFFDLFESYMIFFFIFSFPSSAYSPYSILSADSLIPTIFDYFLAL